MEINLHIERLILDGLPVDRKGSEVIRAVIETELARLVAENGLAASLHSGGSVANAPAGVVQVTRDCSSKKIGEQIAESVHESLLQT
jgi:hypothetical protein